MMGTRNATNDLLRLKKTTWYRLGYFGLFRVLAWHTTRLRRKTQVFIQAHPSIPERSLY